MSMINKNYLRTFTSLLDSAGNDELEARKQLLIKALRDSSLSRDTVADCRFLLRKIQEEQLVRAEAFVANRFLTEAKRA